MPYEVRVVREPYRIWPPRIHNIYSGDVTTDDVVACFNETIALLDQQTRPIDVVGILEKDSSLLNARGIVFQQDLINKLTWHNKLDQIVVVDLNNVLSGVLLKTTLQVALSRPELKVSILSTMEELTAYLEKKYAR